MKDPNSLLMQERVGPGPGVEVYRIGSAYFFTRPEVGRTWVRQDYVIHHIECGVNTCVSKFKNTMDEMREVHRKDDYKETLCPDKWAEGYHANRNVHPSLFVRRTR